MEGEEMLVKEIPKCAIEAVELEAWLSSYHLMKSVKMVE